MPIIDMDKGSLSMDRPVIKPTLIIYKLEYTSIEIWIIEDTTNRVRAIAI
jgi:hypothetical protein